MITIHQAQQQLLTTQSCQQCGAFSHSRNTSSWLHLLSTGLDEQSPNFRWHRSIEAKVVLTVIAAALNLPLSRLRRLRLHQTPRACQLCIVESYLCGARVLHESTYRPITGRG
jgi:hypothetical protein